MASLVYFLVFTGFLITVTQSFTTDSSNEWDVERYSPNPLSYTDEDHYSRDGATVNPMLRLSKKRMSCPAGEDYSPCDANCEITCDNYRKPLSCSKVCMWGCKCNPGLVRGPDKKCIKPRECPKKQHAEAQRNFLTDVKNAQSSEEKENLPDSLNENQPASQTNQQDATLFCRQNEVHSLVRSTCPDDCNNFRIKDRKCMPLFIPSCICKTGFVRGPDGKCIRSYECPEEKHFCPSGEEYSPCHSHCEGNCITREENKNCKKNGRLCVSGCTCKAGLVRGPDGTCIYKTECPTTPPKEPPTKVCPENEVLEKCKAACQRNCSNVHSALPCPRICQPGCICKESLIRGMSGKCIDAEECPKEDYSSDSYETLSPASYTDDDNIPEIPISETGNSLFEELPPISHAKPSHDCPPLHRWVPCGAHCGRNCSNKDEKSIQCRPVCIPGCICKKGLVKGPDGKCITKDKCPKTSDSERDSYVTLNPPPYTDDDYHIPESETEIPPVSETENTDFEEFLPTSHITQVGCGQNEVREFCYSTCPDTCENYKDTKRKCGRICLIPACVCKKGFVKGPNKKCIKPNECPDENKDNCRSDEMFSKCHGNCEKNCTNWAFDLDCPKKCVSGCVCRPGRIRGPDGKCIIWSQCPRGSVRFLDGPSTENPSTNKYTEEAVSTRDNPCPDDNGCRILCRRFTKFNIGRCTGPDKMTCNCYG